MFCFVLLFFSFLFLRLTPRSLPLYLPRLTPPLPGPDDSPYVGGKFQIEFKFGADYPFKAPQIRFLTKIYHPNVKSENGEICADIINANWAPTLNVMHCLTTLRSMLLNPNLDSPLEQVRRGALAFSFSFSLLLLLLLTLLLLTLLLLLLLLLSLTYSLLPPRIAFSLRTLRLNCAMTKPPSRRLQGNGSSTTLVVRKNEVKTDNEYEEYDVIVALSRYHVTFSFSLRVRTRH